MADNVITSFGVLNYSGMLFNKGNTKTPFSTLIGGRQKTTNHVEFVTGQEFQTEGGNQPEISETASLTAPDATFITREQKTNVTQIFHESVYISYAKESNMGTLSGVNIAGQQANPATELDFQVAAKMTQIARDIEYTFINGEYNKATTDATVNKTRGMVNAITSNVLDLGGNPMTYWDIAEGMQTIYNVNAPLDGLVLWVNPVTMNQINADAKENGLTIVDAGRNLNGINIRTIVTPLGEIGLYLGQFLPEGTALVLNPSVCSPVHQPHPQHGNFFLEMLAKTGAGAKYQIFGQLGLDHGPEWYHAKITNIQPTFNRPKNGIAIYSSGGDPLPTVETLPAIESVSLSESPVVGSETAALDIEYTVEPTDTPTLAYQWKIGDSPLGAFTDIAEATSATYTPAAGDEGKYIKCEVTASVNAQGTKLSNAKKVVAAEG